MKKKLSNISAQTTEQQNKSIKPYKTHIVEMEVTVRKYDVDIKGLQECLRKHKCRTNAEIAEELNLPLTTVEHWFRRDKYFAIPEPEEWLKLKQLLAIETDEFDKSIMTLVYKGGKFDMANRIYEGEIAPTLCAVNEKNLYVTKGKGNNNMEKSSVTKQATLKDATVENETYQKVTGSIDCCISKGTSNQLANNDMFISNVSVVRRLTPLECERLQGFPDYWTDIGDWEDSKGKKHKGDADSPRYKALGNSIALPHWHWLADRMVQVLKEEGVEEPTMASLFDGIGGFPLVCAECGCKPVWASEIEEFPMAVTKLRFPDNE